ncbi:MAG: lysophospholipid acyltransferase family protein, partial [Gammaproteobacteria bacterium]|nr:lysophospholipid acyltransferase family protein [Gammaproteobacteria bacterium]
NHSSYFDGVVLAALLRHCPTFIAKRELTTQFVAGTFLRRLGALFADRAQSSEGVQSSTAALAAARSGQTLVFFPEGTLTRMPGVLPFHTGAFYVAALSGSPVVPISIRGTRSVLRGDQWFPRHAAIEVDVAPAISAAGDDWTAVVKLRDAARDEILRRTGEPDLYAQNMTLSPDPAPPR